MNDISENRGLFHHSGSKIFVFLLLAALALRIYGIWDFSLSNDELSAYFRAQFDNWHDLIWKGIIATDPHPAGVQVFLYFWTKFFNTPFLIRLPFVLFSIASLIYIYRLFSEWMDSERALLALAFYTFLEFTTIHGQLARPYAFGILAVSAFVWSWNRFTLSKLAVSKEAKITFLISGLACLYTHYYTALIAGFIGLFGLLLLARSKRLKPYLLFSFIVGLLFLPHLQITLRQLNKGELTSWIDPAKPSFVFDHIFHVLNSSWTLTFLFMALLLFSLYNVFLVYSDRKSVLYKSLLIFAFPILVGHLYSYFFGSALMDRVLYFTTPYLFVPVFVGWPQMKPFNHRAVVLMLFLFTISSTLTSETFLSRQYVEDFKSIAGNIDDLRDDENMIMVGNYNSNQYLNYYLQHDPVAWDMWDVDNDKELSQFMALIRNSDKSSVNFSWACKYQPLASVEYVRRHYPEMQFEASYYNSGLWQLKRGEEKRERLFYEQKDSIALSANEEYLNLLGIDMSHEYGIVNFWASFRSDDLEGVQLVFALNNVTAGVVDLADWRGHKLSDFSSAGNEIMCSFKIPSEFKSIQIYLWNPEFKEVFFKAMELSAYDDSYPNLY